MPFILLKPLTHLTMLTKMKHHVSATWLWSNGFVLGSCYMLQLIVLLLTNKTNWTENMTSVAEVIISSPDTWHRKDSWMCQCFINHCWLPSVFVLMLYLPWPSQSPGLCQSWREACRDTPETLHHDSSVVSLRSRAWLPPSASSAWRARRWTLCCLVTGAGPCL